MTGKKEHHYHGQFGTHSSQSLVGVHRARQAGWHHHPSSSLGGAVVALVSLAAFALIGYIGWEYFSGESLLETPLIDRFRRLADSS